MSRLSIADFLACCGSWAAGRPVQVNAPFVPSTDSRSINPGDTFICLRGPNFDGHDFIGAAVAAGCACVVADDERKLPSASEVPVIVVPDAKAAYLSGAAAARNLFRGRVVAITGSNGKTTTKAFATTLIGRVRATLATPQNENNELGVAKLLYALDPALEVAILEFGSRKAGDITQLVDMAKPDIGVLTCVGEAHMEFFPSEEALAREKFSLFSKGAKLVCNAGDRWSRMLAAEAGVSDKALWTRLVGDPQAPALTLEAGLPEAGRIPLSFGASHAFADWSLVGEHHLRDALLAAAAALMTGLSFEQAVGGFGELRLPPGRFERHVLPSGATVIYDAYNASPTSVVSALAAFAALPAERHIAVLGSMAELGSQAGALHERTGAAVAQSNVDLLYCGGQFARRLADGAMRAGMSSSRVSIFESNARIAGELRTMLRPGDALLLKGSRIEKMEEILGALEAPATVAS